MPPYARHVFVCINERDARAGLKGKVRVNAAGCLDQCAHGVTVVVYPEAVWYGGVTVADLDEIVEAHLVGGRPVERLRLAHMRPADGTTP
jgi:(2Fe-2S) ferredoxin